MAISVPAVRSTASFACIAALTVAAGHAHAGTSLTFLPLGQSEGENFGLALSNDGTQVAGGAQNGAAQYHWSSGTGFTIIPHLPGGLDDSRPSDVSNNGVVVGFSNGANGGEAYRWTSGGGTVGLGDFPGFFFFSEANGVSDDGSIVAGTGTDAISNRSFRWDGSLNSLGSFPATAFDRNHGNGISGDGNTIVGYGFNSANKFEAYTWTQGTGIVGIGNIGYDNSIGEAISADGQVIGGTVFDDLGPNTDSFVLINGTPHILSSPGNDTILFDVSDTGVAVGVVDTGSSAFAFVWSQGTGVVSIEDLLSGVPAAAGWTFEFAAGISADGNTILVSGFNPMGQYETALITIPAVPSGVVMLGLVGVAAHRRRR